MKTACVGPAGCSSTFQLVVVLNSPPCMYSPFVRPKRLYFSLAVVSFPSPRTMMASSPLTLPSLGFARCPAAGGSYKTKVPRVTGIGKDSDPDTLTCMLDNCKQEVIDCAKDSDCRACISCLTSCPPNDQARERTGGGNTTATLSQQPPPLVQSPVTIKYENSFWTQA